MAVLKDLIVHGSSSFLNKSYFDFIKTDTVDAEEGIFKKLTATDANLTNATVVGLLDVQGEMHTNSWSNSNIATIDGNFYITPTAVSADGTDVTASGYAPTGTITYSNTNYTQMTITGTFDTSQLTLDGTSSIAWPANSYVIVTGDVLVGNEWYPLGTIRGKLYAQVAANTSSKTFTIIPIGTQIISDEAGNVSLTDGNGHKPLTLEAIRTAGATLTSLKLRKVKISMTSRGSGSDQYALGIYMTAMGGNKKTFLDIYGGSNKNGVDVSSTISGTTYQSGAFAKPTVRIGNLLGLPSFTLPNNTSVTPTGWGIYTNNGFFSGTIVSTQGKIGNFTLGTAIYGASSGSGPSSISSTTAGTYLGVDGFRNNKSGDTSTYAQITNGVLTAVGAQLKSLEIFDSAGNKRAGATTSGFIVYDGTSATTTTEVAKFGSEAIIGKTNESHFKITSDGIYLLPDDNSYSSGDAIGTYSNFFVGQESYEYDPLIDAGGTTDGLVGKINSLYVTPSGLIYEEANNKTFIVTQYGARIGSKVQNTSRIEISAFGLSFKRKTDNDDVQIAYLGYAKGLNASGSLVDAPFFSFGVRQTTTTQYSSSSTYEIGDMVVYNNNIYVCKARITTPMAWNSSYWRYHIGNLSFAEGGTVLASGAFSHAEGARTLALSDGSHAEGSDTQAVGLNSHAEGEDTVAGGHQSHAEGYATLAYGLSSHAEGEETEASGSLSHAQGEQTIARGYCETVLGRYNEITTASEQSSYNTTVSKYILVAGNGTSNNARSNALTIDWAGNVNIASGAQYKINGVNTGNGRVFYGTCSIAAATQAKTVTCTSYDALTDGDILVVKFTNANSHATPTLNVNSKGAKSIKQIKNGALSDLGSAASVRGTCVFIYDATNSAWILQSSDDNTTYSIVTAGTSTSAGGLMSQADKTKLNGLNSESIFEELYPIGSIYVTSEQPDVWDPNSIGDGSTTWELVDKDFTPQKITSGIFTNNTTNVSSIGAQHVILGGHTVEFYVNITSKVAFGETNLALGTFNLANCGLSSITGKHFNGVTDEGNAVAIAQLGSDGALTHTEVVVRGTGTSIAASTAIRYYITYVVEDFTNMTDSFCNKFYWKRTS